MITNGFTISNFARKFIWMELWLVIRLIVIWLMVKPLRKSNECTQIFRKLWNQINCVSVFELNIHLRSHSHNSHYVVRVMNLILKLNRFPLESFHWNEKKSSFFCLPDHRMRQRGIFNCIFSLNQTKRICQNMLYTIYMIIIY